MLGLKHDGVVFSCVLSRLWLKSFMRLLGLKQRVTMDRICNTLVKPQLFALNSFPDVPNNT